MGSQIIVLLNDYLKINRLIGHGISKYCKKIKKTEIVAPLEINITILIMAYI